MAHTIQEPQKRITPAKKTKIIILPGVATLFQAAYRLVASTVVGFVLGGFGILVLISDNPLDVWGTAFARTLYSPFGLGLAAAFACTGVGYLVSHLLAFVSATIKGDLTFAKRIFTGEEECWYLPPALSVAHTVITLMMSCLPIYMMASAIFSAM